MWKINSFFIFLSTLIEYFDRVTLTYYFRLLLLWLLNGGGEALNSSQAALAIASLVLHKASLLFSKGKSSFG